MGSFNIGGFYSHQEISYNMPCVAFICCEFDVNTFGRVRHYSVPLSLPVFGNYNDYGGIKDVKKSDVTEMIEKFFGYDTDSVLSDITEFQANNFFGERGRVEQILELRENNPEESFMKKEFDRFYPIYEKLQSDHKINNFNIFLAIDHEAVWSVLSKKYGKNDYDWMFEDTSYFEYAQKELLPFGFTDLFLQITSAPEHPLMESFARWVIIAKSNYEFKFRPSLNWSQDCHSREFSLLNDALNKIYDEYRHDEDDEE